MSDPGTSYRSREEVQEVRQTRDPITQFKERILDAGLITPEEIKNIDGVIKKEIDAAVKVAKADKEIPVSELYTDVYGTNIEPMIRGITPTEFHPHATLNHIRNK